MTAAPHVDPAELAETINYLSGLAADRFAQELADTLMEPADDPRADPVLQAFRSPQLVHQSLAACRSLLNDVNRVMKEDEGETNKAKRRGREHFRNVVGTERRVLQMIYDGVRAQQGILPTAPNPRARARERLWQLNLMGDVPQGMANQLLEEEEEKVREAARQARREAKERARAAKRAMSAG